MADDLDLALQRLLAVSQPAPTAESVAPTPAPVQPVAPTPATLAPHYPFVPAPAAASSPWPMLLAVMVLSIAIVIAALLLRNPSPGPDPAPVSKEVIAAFDKAATDYFTGLGTDVEAIGLSTRGGDIKTVDAWVDATKDAFTKHYKQFVQTTGEWDNKYVPQPESELSAEQQRLLGDYTIASGQGLKAAVNK
jgi:hypothetical protein